MVDANLRALVVDDERDLAVPFATLLGELGCDVQLVKGGQNALDLLSAWSVDIAFIDLRMPEMDGFEFADRLQERKLDPPFLVALTGHRNRKDRKRSEHHGFDRYLIKPPDIETLKSILKTVRRRENPHLDPG